MKNDRTASQIFHYDELARMMSLRRGETSIVKFHHGEIFLGAKILHHQGFRFTA